ncbi:MAG: DUF4382 domain-containing protein [Terriglobia bacterium]
MVKRGFELAFLMSLIALCFSGCGSSAGTTVAAPPQTGTLDVEVGDVPLCNILSFRILITGISVSNGVTDPQVLGTNAAIWADFAALQGSSTILNMGAVNVGSYSEGTITVAAPTMTLFDSSATPYPLDVITPTFSTENNIPFKITPPLVVNPNKTSVLHIDFNIPQSVQANGQGQVGVTGSSGAQTVAVTPVFTATPLTASATGGFGELDDVSGYITMVNTTSANAEFTGGFDLQTLSGESVGDPGTGPSITVNLTSTSKLIGVPALNQLTTDNYAEVQGYIDTNGNFVATTAVIEDQEDPSDNFDGFIGDVLSVQKDAEGNVTQFTMTVRDEEPSTGSGVGNPVDLDSPPLTVNVSPTTGLHFSSPSTNFVNLIPNASYLAVGQSVVAQGTYTPPPSTTSSSSSSSSAPATPQLATLAAQDIYIPLQSVEGGVTRLLVLGGDNLSGGFVFSPCPTIFLSTPIYVITDAQTSFQNVNGLSAIASAPSLEVRGLLFQDLQGGEIEGVQVPPGSMVMLAADVIQP